MADEAAAQAEQLKQQANKLFKGVEWVGAWAGSAAATSCGPAAYRTRG
jgi:hypothetical protein